MKYVSKSQSETASVAHGLLLSLVPKTHATVLALSGDLGSGKTTFVQELVRALGIKEVVQSPTFVIMKTYQIEPKPHEEIPYFRFFFHIDAYRLDKATELERLGWKEILAEPLNLVAIEWAERVETLLPLDARRLHFKFIDNTIREIEFA